MMNHVISVLIFSQHHLACRQLLSWVQLEMMNVHVLSDHIYGTLQGTLDAQDVMESILVFMCFRMSPAVKYCCHAVFVELWRSLVHTYQLRCESSYAQFLGVQLQVVGSGEGCGYGMSTVKGDEILQVLLISIRSMWRAWVASPGEPSYLLLCVSFDQRLVCNIGCLKVVVVFDLEMHVSNILLIALIWVKSQPLRIL